MNAVLTEDRRDLVFQALANRTRRALLRRLAQGAERVTSLAEPFGMSLNAISKHLQVLEGAGLVTRSINGRVAHLLAQRRAHGGRREWLSFYQDFWNGGSRLLRILSKARRIRT